VTDIELRLLSRAGTPAARLRLSRSLQRLGQTDDALDALLPARDDASVREAIGRFPAWVQHRGGPGHTSAVDVAPVLKKPRVLWKHGGSLPFDDQMDIEKSCRQFLATAHAVVVTVAPGEGAVLDAETGEVRWRFPHGSHVRDARASILGDTLLVPDAKGLRALDLWTGEDRWRAAVRKPWVLGSLMLSIDGSGLSAFALDPVRGATRLWRSRKPGRYYPEGDRRFVATTTRVFVNGMSSFTELDRRTGRVIAQREGEVKAADEEAFLASIASDVSEFGQVLALVSPERELALPNADIGGDLAPTHIVSSESSPGGLAFFSRSKGQPLVRPRTDVEVQAIARGVLYGFEFLKHGIVGLDLGTGRCLWHIPPWKPSLDKRALRKLLNRRLFRGETYASLDPERPDAIVPAHRRIYVRAPSGSVTCYAEPR
jgi:hypothetical protein